ncbi:MAG TPA: 50S ribosomal protein L29 [Opitutales bacterium]|nr:50S ribosomal protein L29 [Opitutales bacterium]
MNAKKIRELSIEEIGKKLRDARADLLEIRLQKQTGQLEKTHEVQLKRKEIARCETILAEKKAADNQAS